MHATFVEAGWAIAIIKLQRDDEVECLGLRVVVESPVFPCGAIVCPEAKRLGLLREIASQMSAEGSIAFSRVEGLVGRLGNIAQVVPAANTYMQALYRLEHVRLRVGRRLLQAAGRPATGAAGARAIRRRVRSVRVNANTPATADYIRSLSWWRHALERGIQVPLAVPASFPALAAPGSAAIFTDAARESGVSGGAWMALLQSDGSLLFLWCALPWPADIGQALRDNVLSMPAGELGMMVVAICVFRRAAVMRGHLISHLYCYTDSIATRATINHDGSPSPQLNHLAVALATRLEQDEDEDSGDEADVLPGLSEAGPGTEPLRMPPLQLLAVHIAGTGTSNRAADAFSRDGGARWLAELSGPVTTVRLPFPDWGLRLLREAALSPHRHA